MIGAIRVKAHGLFVYFKFFTYSEYSFFAKSFNFTALYFRISNYV